MDYGGRGGNNQTEESRREIEEGANEKLYGICTLVTLVTLVTWLVNSGIFVSVTWLDWTSCASTFVPSRTRCIEESRPLSTCTVHWLAL